MSDISTEITRLENAKATLIALGNNLIPGLFDKDDPPTIDRIALLLNNNLKTAASDNITIFPAATEAEYNQIKEDTLIRDKIPLVVFYNNTGVGAQISVLKTKDVCGARFVNATTRPSDVYGNVSLSNGVGGDIYVIDPNGIECEYIPGASIVSVVQTTIKNAIKGLSSIVPRLETN